MGNNGEWRSPIPRVGKLRPPSTLSSDPSPLPTRRGARRESTTTKRTASRRSTPPIASSKSVISSSTRLPTTLTDSGGASYDFSYDQQQNLTSLHRNGDSLLRLAYRADGLTELFQWWDEPERQFTYDDHGRLATISNPGGGEIRLSYDERGNLCRF